MIFEPRIHFRSTAVKHFEVMELVELRTFKSVPRVHDALDVLNRPQRITHRCEKILIHHRRLVEPRNQLVKLLRWNFQGDLLLQQLLRPFWAALVRNALTVM